MTADQIISNIQSLKDDERRIVADFVLSELEFGSETGVVTDSEIYSNERLAEFERNNETALKPFLKSM